MSKDWRADAEQLFQEAADLPADQRAAFLDQRCAQDSALRREVEALLAYLNDGDETFLEQSPYVPPAAISAAAMAGAPERLGRYRILSVIGSGGMGVVYEAEQDHPRRTVALKVIRPGFGSPSLLRRFEHEAEILGQLRHPGIAQIYEAGSVQTDYGPQPYFAMEMVEGMPITNYAESHGLGTRAKLELLARVCDAVQHAHQRGIVHRDLKPANILVLDDAVSEPPTSEIRRGGQVGGESGARTTPRPAAADLRPGGRGSDAVTPSATPKVLDFGVARMAGADFQTVSMHTDIGQLIGTVPYMSPEQVSGHPQEVDVYSDVYALGVILYELLAGRLPIDVRNCPIPEAARLIREQDPSRLSSINPVFRGDIDTIVSKALEKDKQRRYASAADLAADIRRYLRDEPILARPATTFYQVRKFAKRNKALVAGVAGVLLVTTVGAVVATALAIRAENNARLARAREDEAQRRAYRAGIAAATAALRENDVPEARQRLEATPSALRGWEWDHLSSQLDESLIATDSRVPWSRGLYFMEGGHVIARPFPFVPGRFARWEIDSGARLADLDVPDAAAVAPFVPAVPVFWLTQRHELMVMDMVTHRRSIRALSDIAPDLEKSSVRSTSSPHWVVIHTGSSWWLVPVDAHEAVVQRRYSTDGTGLTVAVGPDDFVAVAFDPQRKPYLWDRRTGQEIPLEGHEGYVRALVFAPTTGSGATVAPSASRLASASMDTTVRLWDGHTGEPVAVGRGHSGWVNCLAFSHDAHLLASGSADLTVRLWDAGTLSPLAVLRGHLSPVTELVFTDDDQRLVSTDEGVLRVWDVPTALCNPVLYAHESYAYSVCFSADGALLASGGWDGTVRLWDVRARRARGAFRPGPSEVYDVHVSHEGKRVACRCAGGAFVVLDATTGASVAQRKGAQSIIAFDAQGTRLLLFDPAVRRPLAWSYEQDQLEPAAFEALRDLASASINSREGLFAWKDGGEFDPGIVHVYGLNTGAERYSFGAMGPAAPVFSADGRWLLTLDDASTVGVRDARTGAYQAALQGNSDSIYVIACVSDRAATSGASSDHGRIVTGAKNGSIRLWDADTFEEVAEFHEHRSYVKSLAISPDGRTMVSASGDQSVRVWDTRPLRERLPARAR